MNQFPSNPQKDTYKLLKFRFYITNTCIYFIFVSAQFRIIIIALLWAEKKYCVYSVDSLVISFNSTRSTLIVLCTLQCTCSYTRHYLILHTRPSCAAQPHGTFYSPGFLDLVDYPSPRAWPTTIKALPHLSEVKTEFQHRSCCPV